jgi:hypothetical protein
MVMSELQAAMRIPKQTMRRIQGCLVRRLVIAVGKMGWKRGFGSALLAGD